MKERLKVSKIDFRFSRRAGYIWLLGIVLTVIPAFASQPAIDTDLTFCPLQKAWVKKGGAVKPPGPLKDICASDASKYEFSYESFRRFSAAFENSRAEHLFFSYAKIGKRAFDAVRSERVPERGFSGNRGSEKVVANGQIVGDRHAVAGIEIERSLRSAIESAQRSPGDRDISESENLRRKSRPRAPPTSL